jgi:hypothetical protein
VAGRHLDVGDGYVRPPGFDEAQQSGGALAGPRNLEAGLFEQPGEAFTQERLVVCEHYAHGSQTCRWVSPADVSSTASLPLSAPTLSSTSVRSVAAPVRAAVGERAEFDVRLPVAEHVECGGDAKPQRPLTPPPSGRNLRDPKFDALFEREPPEEVSELLDAAKFQVHVQLRMAERLDSKVRG